ncbi:MAG: FHA domain-containing protein [Candidatus Dormibacteria bacterium]
MAEGEILALRAADGATVTLERFPILLGRAVPGGVVPDVDVSHLDPNEAVDNRHCELVRDDGGVEVHDLGGVSGTWVDGRRLPPGGRALLRVGGNLRVAGVFLALLPAPGRPGSSPPPYYGGPPAEPGAGSGEWRESAAGAGVPPPPSASSVLPPPTATEERRSGLDLTGAPPLARPELEDGAEAVRLVAGLPRQVRRHGVWASRGEPLTPGELGEAVATARRALGLAEETLSGWGHAGDLELDFLLPPLVERAYLAATVGAPAPIPSALLDMGVELVSRGGILLVAAPHPELALASLAAGLQGPSRRPRVLSYQDPRAWVPLGWPSLEAGARETLEDALGADPLFLVRPPAAVLTALLSRLPRLLGGTVLALEAASIEAALDECARRLGDGSEASASTMATRRAQLAPTLDLILTSGSHGWRLLRAEPDGPAGRWVTVEATPTTR